MVGRGGGVGGWRGFWKGFRRNTGPECATDLSTLPHRRPEGLGYRVRDRRAERSARLSSRPRLGHNAERKGTQPPNSLHIVGRDGPTGLRMSVVSSTLPPCISPTDCCRSNYRRGIGRSRTLIRPGERCPYSALLCFWRGVGGSVDDIKATNIASVRSRERAAPYRMCDTHSANALPRNRLPRMRNGRQRTEESVGRNSDSRLCDRGKRISVTVR